MRLAATADNPRNSRQAAPPRRPPYSHGTEPTLDSRLWRVRYQAAHPCASLGGPRLGAPFVNFYDELRPCAGEGEERLVRYALAASSRDRERAGI